MAHDYLSEFVFTYVQAAARQAGSIHAAGVGTSLLVSRVDRLDTVENKAVFGGIEAGGRLNKKPPC